ncbi:MAG: helix-turn-helix domain-containing protein [Candidatus Diapherotrites archaeon]
MDLKKVLTDLRMGENEAKAYLALLKFGEATAAQAAKETKIPRTLVYPLLEKMIESGLASYVIKNGVKCFLPANPSKLMLELKEKESQLQKAMPELSKLSQSMEKETKVEVFAGKEGLKTVLKDIISQKKDYVAFGEEGRFQKTLPIDTQKFLQELEKSGIHERVLARQDTKKSILKSKNSKFKYLPKEYLTPVTTVVYGNKVANFIWTPPCHGIIIENKEMADSFRSYFENLWKIATLE